MEQATVAQVPVKVAVPSRPLPVPVMPRDVYNQQSLGAALNGMVKKARVLMVGAGGIGCELLKNLVLMGFGHVDVIDLDTIDVSNLNRQFLFRHEHIKKSKATVAKEAALKFNPNVQIVAHHANIKDPQFGVQWFSRFKMVFNALDNLDARRHVNRMCLAADVPLIESGTTGFKSNCQVIRKGVSPCYDCVRKDPPKSFAICTIRSTPSQPIHCIVWGKSYLLNEIFGVSEDDSAFDTTRDSENASEIEELSREAAALRKIRESMGTADFPQLLFDKVFCSDIERLRSMEDMWRARRAPQSLKFGTVMEKAKLLLPCKEAVVRNGQGVWSLEESVVVFMDSLDRLSKRMLELKKVASPSGPPPVITFDKDDQDTLDFVAASANIRSIIFGIETRSRFDIKQMAGNIIPAIATTNAIAAGLCVLEALKVVQGDYTRIKDAFTSLGGVRPIHSHRPDQRNPECPTCSVYQARVAVDFSRATLSDLVERFVRLELGFGDRDIVINDGAGGLLYDVDEAENLASKLGELGISVGSMLTVTDEDEDDPFVDVVLHVEELDAASQGKPVRIVGQFVQDTIPRRPKPKPAPPAPQSNTNTNGRPITADKDDIIVVEEPRAESESRKRPHPDGNEGPGVKRAKTEESKGLKNNTNAVAIKDCAILIGD